VTQTGQLALDLAALPQHCRGDLDYVRAALVDARLRAADEAFRAARQPAPCACDRPLDGGEGRCIRCGRTASA
jgi:hypothetical protein